MDDMNEKSDSATEGLAAQLIDLLGAEGALKALSNMASENDETGPQPPPREPQVTMATISDVEATYVPSKVCEINAELDDAASHLRIVVQASEKTFSITLTNKVGTTNIDGLNLRQLEKLSNALSTIVKDARSHIESREMGMSGPPYGYGRQNAKSSAYAMHPGPYTTISSASLTTPNLATPNISGYTVSTGSRTIV